MGQPSPDNARPMGQGGPDAPRPMGQPGPDNARPMRQPGPDAPRPMGQPGPDTARQPQRLPGPNPPNRPPAPNRPPQPPPAIAAKLPPIGAFGGGFGPAGSGGYSTGSTPVPVRSNDDHPELPTVKDQEKKRPAFLVEGDDDEVFGSGEFTAPQVIGE